MQGADQTTLMWFQLVQAHAACQADPPDSMALPCQCVDAISALNHLDA